MPFSAVEPRSRKLKPEPATKSLTVLETKTSLAAASAAIREPIWTAIPPMSSPMTSHSPV